MGKFVKRNPVKRDEDTVSTVDLKELNKNRFSENTEIPVKPKPIEPMKKELKRSVKGFKMYDVISKDIDKLVVKKRAEHYDEDLEKAWDGSQWIMYCHKMAIELGLDKVFQPLDKFDASLKVDKEKVKKQLQKYS